jgi:hypothetical protein
MQSMKLHQILITLAKEQGFSFSSSLNSILTLVVKQKIDIGVQVYTQSDLTNR